MAVINFTFFSFKTPNFSLRFASLERLGGQARVILIKDPAHLSFEGLHVSYAKDDHGGVFIFLEPS